MHFIIYGKSAKSALTRPEGIRDVTELKSSFNIWLIGCTASALASSRELNLRFAFPARLLVGFCACIHNLGCVYIPSVLLSLISSFWVERKLVAVINTTVKPHNCCFHKLSILLPVNGDCTEKCWWLCILAFGYVWIIRGFFTIQFFLTFLVSWKCDIYSTSVLPLCHCPVHLDTWHRTGEDVLALIWWCHTCCAKCLTIHHGLALV